MVVLVIRLVGEAGLFELAVLATGAVLGVLPGVLTKTAHILTFLYCTTVILSTLSKTTTSCYNL